jgi:hypothetical protein
VGGIQVEGALNKVGDLAGVVGIVEVEAAVGAQEEGEHSTHHNHHHLLGQQRRAKTNEKAFRVYTMYCKQSEIGGHLILFPDFCLGIPDFTNIEVTCLQNLGNELDN